MCKLFDTIFLNSEQKLARAIQLEETNPAEFKRILENLSKHNDLQACLASYELARLTLKTEHDHEWYNMRYQKALAYTEQAIKKDFIFGHMLRAFLCVEILRRSSWLPTNKDEEYLHELLQKYCVPRLLSSLYIIQNVVDAKLNLDKYERIPNFRHFEHADCNPVPSKREIVEAIEDHAYIYGVSAEALTAMQENAKNQFSSSTTPGFRI